MKKRVLVLCCAMLLSVTTVLADVHCKVLNDINEPKDIKTLTVKQLKSLAKDIRAGIINKTNLVGGHVGSDLGVVEVTIAMHYVFDSPTDKFVFDTSHQTYPHKMLTGRKQAFLDPLNNRNITGFSNFNESPHDFFIMGHTSTSISLAEGMAKARDLKGDKYNVIALIGDGSLGGGEALEGLNNAAELGTNIIIIVNDNEMCIAENHGGLYKNLKLLRESNGSAENNMFKALGYEYIYVENGNDIQTLIDTFNKVKNTSKPTIVHIHTLKGKGYQPAVENKEKFHWILPGYINKQAETAEPVAENYTTITKDYIVNKTKSDKRLITISPATPGASGLTPDVREALGAQYADVGIAEQHAVGFASGIAKNGGKPVLMVCSSFIQRAYDQLSQDMAINNSPVVILIYSHGISGSDVTHNGVFDIPLISNIPNVVFMSPSNKEEYIAILDWATKQDKYPVVIRVPQGDVISTGEADKTDYSKLNKYKTVVEGSEIAIIAEGSFAELAKEIQTEIKEKMNVEPTIINPVYLSGLDEELLENLKQNHRIIITLEDGVLDGGFGEKISRFYSNSDMKVYNYGAKKEFTDRVPKDELFRKYHLVPELIITDITGEEGVNSGVNNAVNSGVNSEVKKDVTSAQAKQEKSEKVKEEAKPAPAKEVKEEAKGVNKEVKKGANDKVEKKIKLESKVSESQKKQVEAKEQQKETIKPEEPKAETVNSEPPVEQVKTETPKQEAVNEAEPKKEAVEQKTEKKQTKINLIKKKDKVKTEKPDPAKTETKKEFKLFKSKKGVNDKVEPKVSEPKKEDVKVAEPEGVNNEVKKEVSPASVEEVKEEVKTDVKPAEVTSEPPAVEPQDINSDNSKNLDMHNPFENIETRNGD